MKKLKVFLAVGLLCCGLSMSMAEAKTMTLDKTKVLVPQGFSVANDDLKFKKGTVVELNENNEVITGVLNRDIALRPTGWRNVINDYYDMRKVIIVFSILVFSIRLQVFLFLSQLMLMYAIKAISL